jgi:hypothetical protein
MAARRSMVCLRWPEGLTGYQGFGNLPRRHRSASPAHHVHRAPNERPRLNQGLLLLRRLPTTAASAQHFRCAEQITDNPAA